EVSAKTAGPSLPTLKSVGLVVLDTLKAIAYLYLIEIGLILLFFALSALDYYTRSSTTQDFETFLNGTIADSRWRAGFYFFSLGCFFRVMSRWRARPIHGFAVFVGSLVGAVQLANEYIPYLSRKLGNSLDSSSQAVAVILHNFGDVIALIGALVVAI